MTQVLQCGGVVTYQLLCGREIAQGNAGAEQFANYVYLVVNTQDRTAIAVDAAWDVDGLYDLADRLGVEVRGAVYTHFHFDHCGGQIDPRMTGGRKVPPLPGAREVQRRGGQVWAGEEDAAAICRQCGLESVTSLRDGDVLECGDLVLHALRTPGHTPGSICLFAAPQCLSPRESLRSRLEGEVESKAESGLLITGDTLFVGSCGRTDLPGSSQAEMFSSLARLGTMNPEVVVLPGHNYATKPFSTVGKEREFNMFVQAGLSQVPRPPALPPCCAAGPGMRCGPRGLVIGRKVRLRGSRIRDLGWKGPPSHAEEEKTSQVVAVDDVGVLQEYKAEEGREGQYVIRPLPNGDPVSVPPDTVEPMKKPSAL